MGWTSGKGLGRNEDGMAAHIKVSLKANNLGVGADRKTTDNWMDNTFAFSSLLEGLNKTAESEENSSAATVAKTDDDTANDSTAASKKDKKKKKRKHDDIADACAEEKKEEKEPKESASNSSSTLRAVATQRLAHRRKFHQNKNVASFSEDALNKILGVKTIATPDQEDPWNTMTPSSSSQSPPYDNETTTVSIENIQTRISSVPLTEYFASKMPSALLKSGRQLLVSGLHCCADDDNDERPSFGGLGLASDSASTNVGGGLGLGFGFGRFGVGIGKSFVKSSGEQSSTAELLEKEGGVVDKKDKEVGGVKESRKKDKKKKDKKDNKHDGGNGCQSDDKKKKEEEPNQETDEGKNTKTKKDKSKKISVEAEPVEKKEEQPAAKKSRKSEKSNVDITVASSVNFEETVITRKDTDAIGSGKEKSEKKKAKRDKWGNKI
ncbi:PIN2/TERF1-interacting telomerase inhibitor 1 [Physocladia obscura]|uniref:PIN2/TERF1-interacting telomerase inhibitor 1 n=1 Tax=Physocladia obscura TaxID=109957 RepID=A0AAD5XD60_9FUNG|nr:PIN2/TERF1-interacting telomerase inhibitor 1 [Physocladia obscura]